MNYWYVNLLGLLFFIFPCSGNAQSRTSLQDEVIKEWNNYSLEGATVESILKQRAAVEKMILARDKKDEMARLVNQVKAINLVADYYRQHRDAGVNKSALRKVLKGVRFDSREFLALPNLERNINTYFNVKALADGYEASRILGDKRDELEYEKYKQILETRNSDLILSYFAGIRSDFILNYTEALKKARPLFELYMPEGELRQLVMDLYAAKERLSSGKDAPLFTLIDYKRQEHSLQDFRGKILIIDVWATWCGGCIRKLPYFMKVAEKYKDRADVEFITISIDEEGKFNHWKYSLPRYKLLGVKNLIAFPKSTPFQDDYDIHGIPRYIIIDKDGKIIDTDVPGPGDGFEEFVDKLLGSSI